MACCPWVLAWRRVAVVRVFHRHQKIWMTTFVPLVLACSGYHLSWNSKRSGCSPNCLPMPRKSAGTFCPALSSAECAALCPAPNPPPVRRIPRMGLQNAGALRAR